MDSKAFLRKIFKTGEGTSEEVVKYILKNYFLKDHTLDDFEYDLIMKYHTGEEYAKALRGCFEDELKKYSR